MSLLQVACLQLSSVDDIQVNLKTVAAAIRQACDNGAQLVITPENTCLMEHRHTQRWQKAFFEESHPAIPLFSDLSKEFRCWLLIGSLTIKGPRGLCYNRSYLFDPEGDIKARYDKIHLFDAQLPDGRHFRESDAYHAGTKPVLVKTDWGLLGLSICYDLRFPYLYRYLAQEGASIIAVPSAFIQITGQAHWHVLLRARAIETGSFICAPGQTGVHSGGRQTYGHSLMIDPWGRILAEAGNEPTVIQATLDLDMVQQVRQQIPAWQIKKPDFFKS